jgi:hypothetical protein
LDIRHGGSVVKPLPFIADNGGFASFGIGISCAFNVIDTIV